MVVPYVSNMIAPTKPKIDMSRKLYKIYQYTFITVLLLFVALTGHFSAIELIVSSALEDDDGKLFLLMRDNSRNNLFASGR
jgi:hypothetical protein